MYIGSTGPRGLHHLVYEVVDNSIDEALAGYCDRIEVTVHPDNSVTVTDNGRGIPVDIHPQVGRPALEVVLTRLHAGGKFGGRGYKVSGGLHGVGVSVVNALAEWLEVRVRRHNRLYTQRFARGEPVTELEERGPAEGTGTEVTFRPDPRIFKEIAFDYDTLAQRLRELAFLNRGVTIVLRDERNGKTATFCNEGGIKDFVTYLNRHKEALPPEPVYFGAEREGILVEIALQYTDAEREQILSYANTIRTVDGGTHEAGFRAALTRVVNDYAKKYNLFKNGPLGGEDIREGLTAVISVKVREPQFEGQTKT
ncbi:MAG TPA: DNA topoisomerase IV subunit B, partial [Peptococcaceae bacterium]|nr:DNA topoisomerase IV subunit B [Peptococcaceae bacterium]